MSMRPIESMEVLQRLVNGGAVDTERLVEAAKTALCALDELVKEDQKRLTDHCTRYASAKAELENEKKARYEASRWNRRYVGGHYNQTRKEH